VSTVVGSGQAGALPLALLRTDPYDLVGEVRVGGAN
jgi:hypothetical protein